MAKRPYKLKKMQNGECRVIRIDREAITEFLQEHIMEDCDIYMDLSRKNYNGLFYWTMDTLTGDFIICFSQNRHLDFDKVIEMVNVPTTNSMYQSNRYVSLYLEDGGKKGICDAPSWTQLLWKSISNHRIEMVKFILDQGYGDVNEPVAGETALMFAARESTSEMVELLLSFGADSSMRSFDGKTAYDYAVQANNKDIIAILENNGTGDGSLFQKK